jgi:hypothetical protein
MVLAEAMEVSGYRVVANLLRVTVKSVDVRAVTRGEADTLRQETDELTEGLDILWGNLEGNPRAPQPSNLPIMADALNGNSGTQMDGSRGRPRPKPQPGSGQPPTTTTGR